ncbi:MAG: ribonuclease HII [Patescibacteria group bacterium]
MNLRYENKLWKQGYDHIAGLDEAGRGSWAGPVVAGVVILPRKFKIKGIKDSKQLSSLQREKLFLQIIKNSIAWAVGIIPHSVVDEVGILQANKQAFLKAIDKINLDPDYLIFDGIKFFEPEHEHEFIIKGDDKIMSVAAASIIAKVIRDNLLIYHHKIYPEYGFHNNKGYGTREHREALDNHGLCEIHRVTYRPIEEILNKEL